MKRDKRQKEREKKTQENGSRKQLNNVRVIQRNLVYVTNVPVTIAKEEVHTPTPTPILLLITLLSKNTQ